MSILSIVCILLFKDGIPLLYHCVYSELLKPNSFVFGNWKTAT